MIKIIMDSGKEYTVEIEYTEFLPNLFNEIKGPNGTVRTLKNDFYFLEDQSISNILINPSHISSIEIIER